MPIVYNTPKRSQNDPPEGYSALISGKILKAPCVSLTLLYSYTDITDHLGSLGIPYGIQPMRGRLRHPPLASAQFKRRAIT